MKYLKFFVTILALFGISSCARDIIDLTCTIEGIVKDQTTGAPLSNCEILLTPTNKTITTSRDGIYSFTDLDPGEYSLTFNKSGYITDARNVTTKTGQTTKLEMLLQAKLAGIIQGVVKDKDSGTPISNCEVLLTPGNKTIVTSGDGLYSFKDLESKEYTITFNKNGYASDSRKVTVKQGDTVEVEMLLQAKSGGIIQGVIKDKDSGIPISNCEVLLNPENESLITSSDGFYTFKGLIPGDYTITFNRSGYISDSRSTSVNQNDTIRIDILLKAKSSFSLSESIYDFGDLESNKTFFCFNNSSNSCSYSISNVPNWIIPNKKSGTIAAGSNDSFTLTVDRSKVNAGQYNQNITIEYSGQTKGTEILLVKMKKVEYTTPSITTATSATTVSENSFSIEGTITGTGGSQITAYGHCWSTSKNPTINGQCTNLGMTDKIGTFKSTIENLSANTTYYVRAYATNNQGTAYGKEIIVKTKSTEIEGPWDGQISDSFAGGSGTFIDPYIIKTGGQLLLMKKYYDSYFKLGNDIDLNNNNWLPFEFRGFFDGNGYTIYNLKIYKNSDDLGLFSYLDGATVENVKINGVEIQAFKNSNIGVLAGKARKAVINNCEIYINNTIIGNTNVGGMIGSYEADMYINNCTIKSNELGIIKGNQNVGGFIGCVYKDGSGYSDTKNNHVNINIEGSTCVGGCYGLLDAYIMIYDHSYQGNIRGQKIIGGICGRVNDHVRIISCKSNVNIDASSFTGKDIGGILGGVTYHPHGFYIHACYSTGKISSLDGEAGGLVAYKTYLDNRQDFSIKQCYTTINDNINYSEESSNTSSYKIEECTSVYETSNVSQTMFEFYSEYAKYWNYNNTWTWNGWVDGKEVSISCPKLAWE